MKIFCVGIGGIGLSGVAQMLRSQGHDVSGSDLSTSEITDLLRKSGIQVLHLHSEKNIDKTFDQLIYSEAVPEDNPERVRAEEFGIPQISYAHALGNLSRDKKTIAITGTHGKTTVTGMVTSILLCAKKDPNIIVGSTLRLLQNKNFRVGGSDLFLLEACEYRDNFLYLTPWIMAINTLELDHLDYFKTEERYYASFQKLAEKIPSSGTLILFQHDESKLNLENIRAHKKILPAHLEAQFKLSLQVPGAHNRHNAVMAVSIAEQLGIPEEAIRKGLESYQGAARRWEYKGEIQGAKLYDDYAHHPAKIRATINATRERYPKEKIIAVFQPHQYSRTREFFEDFTKAFSEADEVWITDIYRARDTEEDVKSVSAPKLAKAIQNPKDSKYIPLKDIPENIQKHASAGKVFLVMGAGNINSIFDHLQQMP